MQIQYQPTKLNLLDINAYFYLLYGLLSILYNLKRLTVKNPTIQLEAFQHLLDNLTKLEAVELLNCNLNM
jgi:phage-related holin